MENTSDISHPMTSKFASHRPILGYSSKILRIVFVIFLLSRIGYVILGIEFNDAEIGTYMQFLDPELLRTDLLKSIFYLHMKPPLMNLGVGLIWKIFGDSAHLVFAIIYRGMGALIILSLAYILLELKVSPGLVLLLSLGFSVSPSSIFFENFLFSTYPTLTLLCLSTVMFYQALHHQRFSWCFGFFVVCALMTWTRSLFHFIWYLGGFVLVFWSHRGRRSHIMKAFIVPSLFVLGLLLKNFLLFGFLGTSSWLGLSLMKNSTYQLPLDVRIEWIEAGKLSPVAWFDAFTGPEEYFPLLGRPKTTGIAALDTTIKSIGGPNYNHAIYPAVSKAHVPGALGVILTYPRLYGMAIQQNVQNFLSPATTWHPHDPTRSPFLKNRQILGTFETLYNAIFHGERWGSRTGIFIMLPIMILFGIIQGIYAFYRMGNNMPMGMKLQWFLLYNVTYVTLVSCLIESGPELSRFRFLIDPLLLLLVVTMIQQKNIFHARITP